MDFTLDTILRYNSMKVPMLKYFRLYKKLAASKKKILFKLLISFFDQIE